MTDEDLEVAFRAELKAYPYSEVTHRAYADFLDEHDRPEEADLHRAWTKEKQHEAEVWMDDFALECWHNPDSARRRGVQEEVSRDDLIACAHAWLDSGEWFTQEGRSGGRDVFDPAEFWPRFEILAGRVVPKEKSDDSFVSCSC